MGAPGLGAGIEISQITQILPDPCVLPISEVWIITSSCILSTNSIAPENVMIQNNSVLTIPNNLILTINSGQNITIQSGSGVLIKFGGTTN